jgi:hypothetical protein
MSVAVCAASLAPLAFRATLSPVGSKKARKLSPLAQTLLVPDATDPEATTLELDELWLFVLKKAGKH